MTRPARLLTVAVLSPVALCVLIVVAFLVGAVAESFVLASSWGPCSHGHIGTSACLMEWDDIIGIRVFFDLLLILCALTGASAIHWIKQGRIS
jgi:hypothetical protein